MQAQRRRAGKDAGPHGDESAARCFLSCGDGSAGARRNTMASSACHGAARWDTLHQCRTATCGRACRTWPRRTAGGSRDGHQELLRRSLALSPHHVMWTNHSTNGPPGPASLSTVSHAFARSATCTCGCSSPTAIPPRKSCACLKNNPRTSSSSPGEEYGNLLARRP